MSRVRSVDTKPELIVRRLVYSLGYRYRLHDKRILGKPDLVFWGKRKLIQINGCFWHRHQECKLARLPKSHTDFWRKKLESNRTRDIKNLRILKEQGWKVLTIWECDLAKMDEIEQAVVEFLS